MLKKCVVNFSSESYGRGQSRLINSLYNVGFDGSILTYNYESQLGCKPHKEVPYTFKTYAMLEAYKKGYSLVLWLDASMWAIKNVDIVFDYIEKNNYILESCGVSVGQYTNDTCLNAFGITREQAFEMPMHSSGFTGLNLKNETSFEFLKQWHERAVEGTTFIGAWDNKNKSCSQDERCLGHRHDQSVSAIIAYNLGMKITNPFFMQYDYDGVEPTKDCVFLARGI